MGKVKKYIFDSQTLSLKEVELTRKQKIGKFFSYLGAILVVFACSIFVTFHFFDSPKEKKLRQDLEQSRMQYSILEKRADLLMDVMKDIKQRDENLYRMLFLSEPQADMKQVYLLDDFKQFENNNLADIITRTSQKINILSQQMYKQSVSFDEIYEMAVNKNELQKCIPAILPINKRQSRLVSGFGPRIHPIYKNLKPHTGVDFSAPKGTPVYSTGDGVITATGNPRGYSGYGTICRVNHGFGYETLYAHLSSVAVKDGQKVKRGDLIGYVGSTGTSTAPHLHYEVIKHGTKINPVYFFFNDLSPEEYEKVMEKASEINQSLS